MAGPVPIVRQLILCEHMRYDLDSKCHVLTRPRVDFLVEDGDGFPAAYDNLYLFMQVTGSYGTQKFRIRMVDVTDPTVSPTMFFETPENAIDLGKPFGAYRLQSRSWAVKMKMLLFPWPGRFELWLMFDGLQAAKVEILIEDESHGSI